MVVVVQSRWLWKQHAWREMNDDVTRVKIAGRTHFHAAAESTPDTCPGRPARTSGGRYSAVPQNCVNPDFSLVASLHVGVGKIVAHSVAFAVSRNAAWECKVWTVMTTPRTPARSVNIPKIVESDVSVRIH